MNKYIFQMQYVNPSLGLHSIIKCIIPAHSTEEAFRDALKWQSRFVEENPWFNSSKATMMSLIDVK